METRYQKGIDRFLNTGDSLSLIGKDLKLDRQKLGRILKEKYNIDPKEYSKKKMLEKYEAIYQEYTKNDISIKSICKKHKISDKLFTKYIHDRKEENIIEKIKYSVNSNYFNSIDSEEKAYWLGFLMADGYNSGNYIQLAIASYDFNHIKKFRNCLKSTHKIRYKSQDNTSCITISDKNLSLSLSSLGCTRGKTYACHFPGIKSLPRKYLRHCIRGFFDGDGCIYKMTNQEITSANSIKRKIIKVSFTIKNKNFAEQIIESIRVICGIKANIYYYEPHDKYDVYIENETSIRTFLDCIYKESSIYLDRKYAQYLSYILPSDLEIDEIISAKLSGNILPDYDYDEIPKSQSYIIRTIRTEGTQLNELNYGDIVDSRNASQGQSVEDEAIKSV